MMPINVCVCVCVSIEKDLGGYVHALNKCYIWIVGWGMILSFKGNLYSFQKSIIKEDAKDVRRVH